MQTTSLELSQQLKESGYLQLDSYWYWVKSPSSNKFNLMDVAKPDGYTNLLKAGYEIVSAPLADEILDQLPETTIEYRKTWYGVFSQGKDEGDDKSLSNALARLWLLLKKEGLLNDK